MPNENIGSVTITNIKRTKKKVCLELSNNEEIEINDDIILDYYLFINKELSLNDIGEIKKSAEMAKALKKAYELISKKMYTQKEIEQKLANINVRKEVINNVVQKLKHFKYIDDNAYVEEYLNVSKNKNYGINRIKSNLLSKGISLEILNAIEISDDSQKDSIDNQINHLIKKNANKNYKKAYQDIYNRLMVLGFDSDLINENLPKYLKYNVLKEKEAIKKDMHKAYNLNKRKYSNYKLKQVIISNLLKKGYNYDVIMDELKEFDLDED